MIRKRWIFFAIILCLFLTGCKDMFTYHPGLFKPDRSSCWPCQVYVQTFRAISSVLDMALDTLCQNARIILSFGLLFWLMRKVFPWVVSLTPPKLNEDIPQLIKVLAKAALVGIFLANSHYFYSFIGGAILQPIGTIFMKVSEFILLSPSSVGVSVSQYSQSESSILGQVLAWVNQATSSSGFDWRNAFSQDGVSEGLERFEEMFTQSILPNGQPLLGITEPDPMFGRLPMQIQNVVWQIYSALWVCMGLVFQLLTSGYFVAFVAAVILGFCVIELLVKIPLSFVDAFFQLGMGIILLPLFMVAWVFPLEMFKGIAGKWVQLMLGAFFDILFSCIYVTFLISILRVYVQEKMPDLFSSDFQTSAANLRHSGIYLTMDFLVMFMLVYTVCKLYDSVGSITSHFFEGAGKGDTVGDAAMKLGKLVIAFGVATGRAAITGGTDLSGYKDVWEKTKDMFAEGAQNMNTSQNKEYWKNDLSDWQKQRQQAKQKAEEAKQKKGEDK